MKNVTIHRCPVCSNIGSHTEQLKAELANDPNVNVEVIDGNKGEFTVEVDGQPIRAQDNDTLRPVNEIVEEIRGVEVAAAG